MSGRRLNKHIFLAGRGETEENVIDFETLYPGMEFGDPGVVSQWLGSRGMEQTNAGSVCVRFRTGMESETNVGFRVGGGLYFSKFFKGYLIISPTPWANPETDEIICSQGLVTPYENEAPKAITFLSADGVTDPLVRTEWRERSDGSVEEIVLPTRPRGFTPDTVYYATLRSQMPTAGWQASLPLDYFGTDDPENGGEVDLSMADISATPGAIPMKFANLEGVFIEKGKL